MDRLKEIEARKAEIKNLVESLNDVEEIKKLNEEVDTLTEEERDLNARLARDEIAKKLERSEINASKIENKEEEEMEKKFTIASPEYRSAWAKTMMKLSDDKFTEDEKRALGDAITTTATEFVASTAGTQGINNGGLFIPTSVRMELLELLSENSPIFNDIRKLQVSGNVDLPYLFSSDDSNWYAETTETVNEGIEFKNLQLTGWELAKDIVISWKLEEMAVDSFIEFIVDELFNKMGKALITACIYGDGSNKPTGVTNGLTPVTTGTTVIDRILNVYKSLSADAKVGAKVYVSPDVNLEIVSYKDENGNYPFLAGIPSVSGFSINVDPYLTNNDILAGNMRNYILNEVTSIRLDKETTVKGRKVTYGAYGIYDGKARPNYFALGRKSSSV